MDFSEIEAKDITGSTALMKAVAYKAISVCRLLVRADAGLRDKAGNDAALAAAGKDSQDVLAFLLKSK